MKLKRLADQTITTHVAASATSCKQRGGGARSRPRQRRGDDERRERVRRRDGSRDARRTSRRRTKRPSRAPTRQATTAVAPRRRAGRATRPEESPPRSRCRRRATPDDRAASARWDSPAASGLRPRTSRASAAAESIAATSGADHGEASKIVIRAVAVRRRLRAASRSSPAIAVCRRSGPKTRQNRCRSPGPGPNLEEGQVFVG